MNTIIQCEVIDQIITAGICPACGVWIDDIGRCGCTTAPQAVNWNSAPTMDLFQCSECPATFTSHGALAAHIWNAHGVGRVDALVVADVLAEAEAILANHAPTAWNDEDQKACLSCGGSGSCGTCGGSGMQSSDRACGTCGGSGNCNSCQGSGMR